MSGNNLAFVTTYGDGMLFVIEKGTFRLLVLTLVIFQLTTKYQIYIVLGLKLIVVDFTSCRLACLNQSKIYMTHGCDNVQLRYIHRLK